MDGRRFDSFVVALGRTTSRRQWLKACTAGLLAGAVGAPWRRARAQDNTQRIQLNTRPLPNFPFLVAVPTDSRFAAYAIDDRLTGPPTRYRSLDAMTDLTTAWRSALSAGFQSAYAATIASPSDDDPDEPARAVTTVVYDLGSEEAAEQARDEYVDAFFSDPSVSPIESDAGDDSQVVLGGCEGGCERLSRPTASSEGPVNEIAVIGSHGQFVFDARLQRFNDDTINSAEGDAVARLITGRLSGVTALTSGASASRALPGSSLLRRFSKAFRPNATVRARAQVASDDLRDALASRNSLPIFDLGDGEPPQTATQTLIVDDGLIVVKFGESAASAAARQRSAEDVIFACGTDQLLPMDDPYHDGYDLSLHTVQSIFLSEEDAQEYLDSTRERLQRDRPRIELTEVLTNGDEVRDVYQDGRESDGFFYGCQTHQILRLGAVTAILHVDLIATPQSDTEDPIEPGDLEAELCPIVLESAEKFVLCVVSPDECRSAMPLSLPQPLQPGPDCDPPNRLCNGVCIDPRQDASNCGTCGNVCTSGRTCSSGQCECAQGLEDCGNYCADLSADPGNCGDCGLVCGSNEYCAAGECACTSGQPRCGDICCGDGMVCDDDICFQDCIGTLCGGVCTDTMIDPNNCGDCGLVCSTTGCCSGVCIDLITDPNHCGGCNQGCGSGMCCGGFCSDLGSDPLNCGYCGNNCSGGSCCNGSCCDGSCCLGQCTDTGFDESNCGSCGNACAPSQICESGSCTDNG